MIIEFKDLHTWRMCNDEKALKKFIGLDNVSLKQIRKKLDALLAFQNLGEVPKIPPYRLHSLFKDYAGCFAVDINGKYRLIIAPVWPREIAKSEDNFKYVTEIVIREVVNYHD